MVIIWLVGFVIMYQNLYIDKRLPEANPASFLITY